MVSLTAEPCLSTAVVNVLLTRVLSLVNTEHVRRSADRINALSGFWAIERLCKCVDVNQTLNITML